MYREFASVTPHKLLAPSLPAFPSRSNSFPFCFLAQVGARAAQRVAISPLESALTKTPPVTPLESALTKTPGGTRTPPPSRNQNETTPSHLQLRSRISPLPAPHPER